MTSEDYMSTPEWDHEIDMIIQDMREKLYDLKDRYVTEAVPMSAYKDIEDYRDYRDVKNPNG
jgi:hypothetical protein